MKQVTDKLTELCLDALNNYGYFTAALVIGMLIGWYFKHFVTDRKYNKQIELRFIEKDRQIDKLNQIILERLKKVNVDKVDKDFFKRVKKYFKNITPNKKK